MCSVHRDELNGPMAYACAQAGCRVCQERLVCEHAGLVHAVVQRQHGAGLPYADLIQEGWIGLWQAVQHFDPGRGVQFSTYAWYAIARHVWRAVARAQRPEGWLLRTEGVEVSEEVEEAWQRRAVAEVIGEMLGRLPEREREVIVAVYGLEGQEALSLAELGRRYGVSGERVRQWRNNGLARLRHPGWSGRLRALCDQNSRAAYQRAQALNRAWQRQQRCVRRRGGLR